MFLFQFKKEIDPADITVFLSTVVSPEGNQVYAEIYRDEQGHFHLLGASEVLPTGNAQTYLLSEEQYFEFQNKFNPAVMPDSADADNIQSAIAEAHRKMIVFAKALLDRPIPDALSEADKDEVRIFQEELDVGIQGLLRHFNSIELENDIIKEYLQKLPRKMLEAVADLDLPVRHSLSNNKISALQGLQDAIWMAQSSVTTDFLKYGGGKIASALAVASKTVGIAFGTVTGVFMGVGCGLLSAKIYENRAVNSFEEKHARKPTEKELKLIQRDAKHVGHSVFYGMSFWSLFAGAMEAALHIAKVAAHFHPVGIVVNVLISTAAGVGQAVGACVAQYSAEKDKCRNPSGQFDAKKWDEHKTSGPFVKTMVKVAVTSFLSGFAWGMISNFVPAPLHHAMKEGAAKVAKVFVKMAYRAVAAGLATFGIAYTASRADSFAESTDNKVPVLGFLKKKFFGGDENKKDDKEKETEGAKRSPAA